MGGLSTAFFSSARENKSLGFKCGESLDNSICVGNIKLGAAFSDLTLGVLSLPPWRFRSRSFCSL